MKNMKFPGYSAEAALYKSKRTYLGFTEGPTEAQVTPAQYEYLIADPWVRIITGSLTFNRPIWILKLRPFQC
jgi:hypothetical protein